MAPAANFVVSKLETACNDEGHVKQLDAAPNYHNYCDSYLRSQGVPIV